MSAHTPGPWQVIDGNVYGPHSKLAPFTDNEGNHHPDYRTDLIAIVYEASAVPPHGAANARLIAAAPELAAELRKRLAAETLWVEDPVESFEREAAAFYRETGIMAPGKDIPVEMNPGYDQDERRAAWRAWNDKQCAARHARWGALLAKIDGGANG